MNEDEPDITIGTWFESLSPNQQRLFNLFVVLHLELVVLNWFGYYDWQKEVIRQSKG